MTPNKKKLSDRWTYKKAGVDLEGVRAGHQIIYTLLEDTVFPNGISTVVHGPGHYAGLIKMDAGRVLAIHTDGVGTKVLVAQMMKCFDTIGIDCIAMNVNDLICVGAEPLAFVDYIALKKANRELVEDIMKGLVRGARKASVPIVGGETAVMPGVIEGEGDKAFDLAGTVVGFVDEDKIITGSSLRVGDVVVGAESSGIHSNGLTLARKVLLRKHTLNLRLPELGKSIGQELLTPSEVYVKPVLNILRKGIEVSGMAHITGGAFSKLKRICLHGHVGFELNQMPAPLPIFKLIQREGGISNVEMYRTFNMGVGFCICTPQTNAEEVKSIFKKHHINAQEIGKVVSNRRITIGGKRIA